MVVVVVVVVRVATAAMIADRGSELAGVGLLIRSALGQPRK